jgi:hypothetical protein
MNAKNIALDRYWLAGVIGITLNLFNVIAWSQHHYTHIFIYAIFLLFIASEIIKDKTDNKILLIIFCFFTFLILTEPISTWDARSIWFFHAKRIFFDNNLYAQFDGYAPFSHNDYPPLIPALAASISKSFGFWNEYLPRISILLALFPICLIYRWLFDNPLAFNFWLAGLLIICNFSLINGYMDSLLATYIGAACLLITKIYSNKNIEDKLKYYLPLFLILTSLPLIKNEGLLAALIFILLLIPRVKKEFYYIALSAGSLALYVILWKYALSSHDIQNGLVSSNFSEKIISRTENFSDMLLIIKKIIRQSGIYLLVLSVFLFKYKNIKNNFIAVFFILIYLSGIFIIYTITPYDLNWHLNTSADRVLLSVNLSMFSICTYLFFKKNLIK